MRGLVIGRANRRCTSAEAWLGTVEETVDETRVYAGEEGFEMRVRPKSRLVNEKTPKARRDKNKINTKRKKRALRDTWHLLTSPRLTQLYQRGHRVNAGTFSSERPKLNVSDFDTSFRPIKSSFKSNPFAFCICLPTRIKHIFKRVFLRFTGSPYNCLIFF